MIRFVGDVCFADGFFDIGFGVGSKLQSQYNPFEHLSFDKEDVWIGNLECVISDVSAKPGHDAIPFRVEYEKVSAIPHMNIYCVANNHVMQHGTEAFNNNLRNITRLKSNHVGSCHQKSIVFNHKEKSFGLINFSLRGDVYHDTPLYWVRPEMKEVEEEMEKLLGCDFRCVYMHWGNEFINYPYVEQKTFAHWLVDCGADIVIGTHPHVLQGFEVYKGKYIFYSLGNFLFNMPLIETNYSAIVKLDVKGGELTVDVDYVKIDTDNRPVIVPAKEVPNHITFNSLNLKLNFDFDNEVYYKALFNNLARYRRKNHVWILKNLHRHSPSELISLLRSYVKRRL